MPSSVRSSNTSMNPYSSITNLNNGYNVNGSICKVCNKIYKDPVTLPCGHSLCDGCCKQLLYTLRNSSISLPMESQNRPRIRMGLGTYSKVNTLKSVGINIDENNINDIPLNSGTVTRITKNDFTSPSCPTCGCKPSLIPPYKNITLANVINDMEILKNITKQFKKIMKCKGYDGESSIYKSISPTPSSASSGYGHSEDDYYKYYKIPKYVSNDKIKLPESYRIKECKILVVGGEKVGKSTLIKAQLLNDAFFGDDDNNTPQLISPSSNSHSLQSYSSTKEINSKNDILKSNINGIALVYSVTDRFSLVEVTHFYYMLQETNYENIPICLIGLKSDVHEWRRKVTYNEGLKRSKELKCQFYEVSGRYNKGVNEAFEGLVKVIDKQKSKK